MGAEGLGDGASGESHESDDDEGAGSGIGAVAAAEGAGADSEGEDGQEREVFGECGGAAIAVVNGVVEVDVPPFELNEAVAIDWA